MSFMLWSMDIVHRNAKYLGDADYLSRCGADLCYDPLVLEYLNFTTNLRKLYSVPSGQMLPENMPGYHGPSVRHSESEVDTASPANFVMLAESLHDPNIAPILDIIFLGNSGGMHHCLTVVPIVFKFVPSAKISSTPKALFGNQICAVAREVLTFAWGVYGFNSGHFFSNLASRNIPFYDVLAADTRPSGRALLKQFVKCPTVSVSLEDPLQAIKASRITSTVHGYFIHLHRSLQSSTQLKFWKTQAAIIKVLQPQRGLMIFVARR